MVTLLCHSCNVTQWNSCKTNREVTKKKKHAKVFTIFTLIFQKYNVKIRIDDVSRCYFFHQRRKCMKLNNSKLNIRIFSRIITRIRQIYIIKSMGICVFKQDILYLKHQLGTNFANIFIFHTLRSFFFFFPTLCRSTTICRFSLRLFVLMVLIMLFRMQDLQNITHITA